MCEQTIHWRVSCVKHCLEWDSSLELTYHKTVVSYTQNTLHIVTWLLLCCPGITHSSWVAVGLRVHIHNRKLAVITTSGTEVRSSRSIQTTHLLDDCSTSLQCNHIIYDDSFSEPITISPEAHKHTVFLFFGVSYSKIIRDMYTIKYFLFTYYLASATLYYRIDITRKPSEKNPELCCNIRQNNST